MLERLRQRIQEKAENVAAPPVLIVALGDSVTMGSTVFGRREPDVVYHARLKWLLEQRYPQSAFSTLNEGVNGGTAEGGLERRDAEVIYHHPDLVIVGFGLNDTGHGRDGLPAFAKTLREIVRRIRAGTDADVILLTSNFMNTRDNSNVADVHRDLVEDFIDRQTSGLVGAYAEAVRDIGRELDVPVADVYAAWEQLADRGVDTTDLLANGLNHPTAEAHRIPAEVIMKLIDDDFRVTVLDDLGR